MGNTPLLGACEDGSYHESLVELLDHPKIDMNKRNVLNMSPLNAACRVSNYAAVALLLSKGRFKGLSMRFVSDALFVACEKGDARLVRCLLKYDGIDVNERRAMGKAPMHVACCIEGDDANEVLEALMDAPGVDLNICDQHQETPLHYCVIKQRADLAAMLLKAGAGESVRDGTDLTPVLLAEKYCMQGMIEVFYSIGRYSDTEGSD